MTTCSVGRIGVFGAWAVFSCASLLVAQCETNGYVTKSAYRSGDNTMKASVIAWTSGGYWFNYTATVNGSLHFRAEGSPTSQQLDANVETGLIQVPSASTLNPTVSFTAALEPRGNGAYFSRGGGLFVCIVDPTVVGSVGTADSPEQVVLRPQLSGLSLLWYMGPGIRKSNWHQAYTDVTLTRNGTVGTPNWFLVQGNASLSCSSCEKPEVQILDVTSSCSQFNVKLKATFSGFSSEEHWILSDTFWSMTDTFQVIQPAGAGLQGYVTMQYMNIAPKCASEAVNPEVNESFGSFSHFGGSNWGTATPIGWQFFEHDDVYAHCSIGNCTMVPPPLDPPSGANCVSIPTPLMVSTKQTFRTGSQTVGSGRVIRTNTLKWYQDRGCHTGVSTGQ